MKRGFALSVLLGGEIRSFSIVFCFYKEKGKEGAVTDETFQSKSKTNGNLQNILIEHFSKIDFPFPPDSDSKSQIRTNYVVIPIILKYIMKNMI